ncbi:MAG: hypothetical protein CL400_04675 [Acidiferrobacteraceae bacterium]|nr:hypothetical protein [Acidiferrobacteraceae bacterium]
MCRRRPRDKKSGSGHRFFEKGYIAGMTAVFLSALPLAAFQAKLFLLLIAFFTFYLVFSGFRFARNKTGAPGGKTGSRSVLQCCRGSECGVWAISFLRVETINESPLTSLARLVPYWEYLMGSLGSRGL